LARALLRSPQLLILDEASANLDAQTEEKIAALIHERKGTCTAIIVSHRPGMLQYTDHVLHLGNKTQRNNKNQRETRL
ncbi:ABC transporter ATP-binding protein, partial [Candidatus Woesearchaeota archaeon]